MSPLGRLLLKVMRVGLLAAAVFLVAVLGLELYKLWRFGSGVGNQGFLAVVAVMLAGSLLLARSISRELARYGS